jgi:hypothetical protein
MRSRQKRTRCGSTSPAADEVRAGTSPHEVVPLASRRWLHGRLPRARRPFGATCLTSVSAAAMHSRCRVRSRARMQARPARTVQVPLYPNRIAAAPKASARAGKGARSRQPRGCLTGSLRRFVEPAPSSTPADHALVRPMLGSNRMPTDTKSSTANASCKGSESATAG